MPSKSIYRRPGAQHFQLVHRSQRDPLIHDPDANQHVLKSFQRENDVKKGKYRADLEALLEAQESADRPNVGEASLYGIYYNDAEYNYMQHLRETGVEEDGVETIMIEAPTPRKGKDVGKTIELRLPPDVLPSTVELDRTQVYDAQQAVPDTLAGFQPDMDPHLRQVLEALEEDAFVDDELDDAFFGELLQGGERIEGECMDFEFTEDGEMDRSAQMETEVKSSSMESWESRFARFKKKGDAPAESASSEVDGFSEGEDTLERLPVIGGKRRRRGAASESSGFSMTSSAVFRNEGLTMLDERYNQIESVYDETDEDKDEDSESDEAPELLETREDFEAVMDDFLANYELVGRRMAPVLRGDTAAEKLNTIRRALGSARLGLEDEVDEVTDMPMPHDIDDPKDRWDCETILSTYTNVENHPRLIKTLDSKPVPRIRLDPHTGFPIAGCHEQDAPPSKSDNGAPRAHTTVSRARDESKEDKRARKLAVKQERQTRRVEKKATREEFLKERKRQINLHAHKPPGGIKAMA